MSAQSTSLRHRWIKGGQRPAGTHRFRLPDRCECGLVRKTTGLNGCFAYFRDGVEVPASVACTRIVNDHSVRARGRQQVRVKLAPFLREDANGEAARAALPKKPPGRRATPGGG